MSAVYWFVGVLLAAVVGGLLVFAGLSFAADRAAADACWAVGGVPVQGDQIGGLSVVCLDSSVLLEVTP